MTMLHPTNNRLQIVVGIAVFLFFAWLMYSTFGKIGIELTRLCGIAQAGQDACRVDAGDLSLPYYIALLGCVLLGYGGYRFSGFAFKRKS